MTDYISREAAIAAAFSANAFGNSALRDVCDTVKRIRMITAADVVERITAKEVREEDDYWRCSNCKCSLSATMYVTKDRHLILHPNYCPNCGARMVNDDV